MQSQHNKEKIPIIDLFAGPGGLGEGFSSELGAGLRPFHIALSVEKDPHAHKTLSLRAFYRYFLHEELPIPEDYYRHLAGEITLDEMLRNFPKARATVEAEAICATLGGEDYPYSFFDEKITAALKGRKDWLLIGGPPCQAYSLVGRSKMLGDIKPEEDELQEEFEARRNALFGNDPRHKLYQEYLRIIYKFSPAVFVMENVKGILSAKVNDELVFPRIIDDLSSPKQAANQYGWEGGGGENYRILSFVKGSKIERPRDYLIECEKFEIPQARHRVILLGIREDVWANLNGAPLCLEEKNPVTVKQVIKRTPRLRSGFSKGKYSKARWRQYFGIMQEQDWVHGLKPELQETVVAACKKLESKVLERKHRRKGCYSPDKLAEWFVDSNLHYLPNHETRAHMDSDLDRYLFVSAYGAVVGSSPRLKDFPLELLPAHKNVDQTNKKQKFADRFKVQRWNEPASTITSHISKDGHYFIHPDPAQCRSLTVREAARIQTFPDNYFFEGGRTQQYHQVGNAVPPYLAKQLAEVVWDIFQRI